MIASRLIRLHLIMINKTIVMFFLIFCNNRLIIAEQNNTTLINPELNYEGKSQYFDCVSNFCISKCCSENYFVNQNLSTFFDFPCLPYENGSKEGLLVPKLQFPNGTEYFNEQKIAYIVHLTFCKVYNLEEVILLPNASLLLPSTGEVFCPSDYCLDHFKDGDKFSKKASVCSMTYSLSQTEMLRNILHPLGFFISCIFLAVTFICHVIIPKLRDVQGLCFMSYVAALFFAFLFLSANILIPNSFSTKGCVALAVLSYFALLSSFFWLNVMSFDIWRVIRGSVHAIRMQEMRSQGKVLFLIYSLYGWGVPLVLSVSTLIIHALHVAGFLPEHFIKPEFRFEKCWFSDNFKVLFAYYYGFIAVLFFINIVFYIHICVMLYQVGAAFKCCSKDMSHGGELRMNNRSNLSTFWHRFCLFLLMGLNWSTEVLSLIPPPSMWVITDVMNTFQGLFIFLLFIRSTKKRTLIVDVWKRAIQMAQVKKHRKKSVIENLQTKFMKNGIDNKMELTNETFLTLERGRSPFTKKKLIRKSL